MKKNYIQPALSITGFETEGLFLSLSDPMKASVTIEDYVDGFEEEGGYLDITLID